jgi:hypothetical protein
LPSVKTIPARNICSANGLTDTKRESSWEMLGLLREAHDRYADPQQGKIHSLSSSGNRY